MCTHHTHLLSGKGCAACFVRCHPCVSYCLAEETCRRPGPRATSGSVDVQLDWYSNAHKHQQMNTWKVPQDTSNLFSSSFHREERQRNWSAAEPRSSQSMLPQIHLWHILIIQLLQKTLPEKIQKATASNTHETWNPSVLYRYKDGSPCPTALCTLDIELACLDLCCYGRDNLSSTESG